MTMGDLVPVRRERAPMVTPRPYAPQRWDPFRDFEDLWDRMTSRFFAPPATMGDWPRDWSPLVDVEETDDSWIFEVELPGVDRDDITIEVSDRELSITGEIKERERERVGVLRHRTRQTGTFRYQATLPAGVDPDRVEARYHNGVLTVRVPRPEQSKPRKLKIG
jgi:HSP20 family protein